MIRRLLNITNSSDTACVGAQPHQHPDAVDENTVLRIATEVSDLIRNASTDRGLALRITDHLNRRGYLNNPDRTS